MTPIDPAVTPSGHTPEGGVLVGNTNARHEMILYEDPQCPFCRQFEELGGPVLAAAVGAGLLAVEYRMRCFLGEESVRADNALALAAEAGRFDQLRQALFSAQPPEGSGGFTVDDLLRIGADAGLTGSDYVAGVREARYEKWVLTREESVPGTGSARHTSGVVGRRSPRLQRAFRATPPGATPSHVEDQGSCTRQVTSERHRAPQSLTSHPA